MTGANKRRIIGSMCIAGFAAAVAMSLPLSAAAVVTLPSAGTTLIAEATARAQWKQNFKWTISKTVTPASWQLLRGDSGTSMFTVSATREPSTEISWVDGQVCVTNTGAEATQGLSIVATLLGGPGFSQVIGAQNVPPGANAVIEAGDTACFEYRVDLPASARVPGGSYQISATVTISNPAGSVGAPAGPTATAVATLPNTPLLLNASVNVDDSNGMSWVFNGSGSQTYPKTFTCDQGNVTYRNRATIRQTGQFSEASVTVTCFSLKVRKDVFTSLQRRYIWTIDKAADQSELTLAVGQQYQVTYTVDVNAQAVDSAWLATGTIRVTNMAPFPVRLLSMSDIVSPDIVASVSNCVAGAAQVTLPYTLGPNWTIRCNYAVALPSGDSRVNTAIATAQNMSYDAQGRGTPAGASDFSGTAEVSFARATLTEIDKCVSVSDSFAGDLGAVCAPNVPARFTYTRWIGPYEACGSYTVENVASFVAGATGAAGSDRWDIAVNVPCDQGCARTQGYWGAHSKHGPAPYDATWALVMPDGEDSPFFSSGQTWYQVMQTSSAGGNAYYILARQYIAAALNQLSGANTSVISAELALAAQLLADYTPASTITGALRDSFINTAGTLDDYNNGVIGPGHCSR